MIRKICILLLGVVLVACHEDNEPSDTSGEWAVNFSTEMSTRALTLINTTEELKALPDGVGVFAYMTDGTPWATAISGKTASTYPAPDFMNNQKVYWGVTNVDNSTIPATSYYDWTYFPLKYWPNSSNNATPRRISFFAYAPFQATTGSEGITELPNASDKRPHLVYCMPAASNMVDLLWATPAVDATRNGEGLITVSSSTNIYQKVPLEFHHALASIDVYVQRIYDEPAYSGKHPASETHTKLFISQLSFATTPNVFETGRLDLADGTWSDTSGSSPTLAYTETQFSDTISGTTSVSPAVIADRELDKWGEDLYGVTDVERQLFAHGTSVLFFPQDNLVLTPTLTYSMITRDNELLLSSLTDMSGNKYARVVNVVTGNSLRLDLKAGKRYKLVIHVGVEHVEFELASVEDWDFPMRFNPGVDTFTDETVNHTVNE